MLRVSKIIGVSAIAFYCFLVVLGNITDYFANFPSVVLALTMKEIFPNSSIGYRAITTPWLQHLAFLIILSFEAVTATLCAYGTWQLFKARHATAQIFNQSKTWAIAGLTCGFVTWQVLFMTIGGEWFGLWMSRTLQGSITNAFHIYMTILGILIYLVIKDD